MSQDDLFDTFIARVINTEGGYTDDPRDPGNWTGGKVNVGECKGTKFGIAAASFPHLDIANLTLEQAEEIYRQEYWENPAGVPKAALYQLLDAAVNHGTHAADKMLQRAVGVTDDGVWGPASAKAAEAMDPNDILLRFLSQRLRYMTGCSAWPTYGAGWANRIAENLVYGAEDN
jgi:lysozyme family protein